jgi:hypothetical protein
MKKQLLCLFLFAFCFLSSAFAQNLPREYYYDAAGNRTIRKIVTMNLVPPAPQDSTLTESFEADSLTPHTSYLAPHTADFYVENIAQTEIKIYPNPTTEKITLEITGWETLQTGIFKLYNLSGQLLQERSVYSVTTEVSLANLPQGAYILKVQINDRIEDWKIIKN